MRKNSSNSKKIAGLCAVFLFATAVYSTYVQGSLFDIDVSSIMNSELGKVTGYGCNIDTFRETRSCSALTLVDGIQSKKASHGFFVANDDCFTKCKALAGPPIQCVEINDKGELFLSKMPQGPCASFSGLEFAKNNPLLVRAGLVPGFDPNPNPIPNVNPDTVVVVRNDISTGADDGSSDGPTDGISEFAIEEVSMADLDVQDDDEWAIWNTALISFDDPALDDIVDVVDVDDQHLFVDEFGQETNLSDGIDASSAVISEEDLFVDMMMPSGEFGEEFTDIPKMPGEDLVSGPVLEDSALESDSDGEDDQADERCIEDFPTGARGGFFFGGASHVFAVTSGGETSVQEITNVWLEGMNGESLLALEMSDADGMGAQWLMKLTEQDVCTLQSDPASFGAILNQGSAQEGIVDVQ